MYIHVIETLSSWMLLIS